jgi:DNA-binding NarL/FixJ family response regulator
MVAFQGKRNSVAEPDAIRILIVDDTPEMRTLLRLTFELEGGFECVGEAGNGNEAAELARSHQPDAILLDYNMPYVDGINAIPLLRTASPGSKIVMLSSRMLSDTEDEALAAGADAYFEKTTAPDQLALFVRQICQGDESSGVTPQGQQ